MLSRQSRAATAGADDIEAYAPKHSFIATDPPDHDRMRRQVQRQFGPPHSPGLIPSMEPVIQRLCDDLLDNVNGKNRFDVVDDYAYPVPVSVICKILGVPLEDERMFHALIFDELAGVDFSPEAATEEGQARAAKGREAAAKLMQYLRELIDRYAREPGEGLISRLLHDDGPDGPMSPEEAVPNTSLMFIAGHDSTVNTIAHCVLTALRNPGSLELLRSRPELIPRAIEETLRLQSAVQFFPTRSATSDIEVGGTVIPAGAAVILSTAPPTATRSGSSTQANSIPNARTTSTSAGAAASTSALVVRSRAWRSTSHSRPSSAAWRIRGSSKTRRRIGATRFFEARCTCGLTATASGTKARESVVTPSGVSHGSLLQ